ncbi:hypothetical protein [Sphingobacterium siyangense]|uniref:hypothetical protein n=1 Tax=Sphingobacterium siyangense TaxID=459529 RepID=UPI00301B552A
MNKLEIINTVAKSLGFTVEEITTDCRKSLMLYTRYIAIQVLKEEGYSPEDIATVFTSYVVGSIKNHCQTVFDELIRYNQKFKGMYLKAAKAVEDMDDENQNEKKSA